MLRLLLALLGRSDARSAIVRILTRRESRKRFLEALNGTNTQPQSVECDRCKKIVDAEFDPKCTVTAGYYHVAGEVSQNFWAQFADIGEEDLCDACMWKDPRYIAVYGKNVIA